MGIRLAGLEQGRNPVSEILRKYIRDNLNYLAGSLVKLRRREINVFSMSALDLFASGMGAFILLAVMALPFFPNTGDSEERIEDIKDQLAEVREQRDNARDRASGLEQVLAKIQRDTDVQQVLQEALNDALRQIEDTRREVRDLEEALAKAKELQPDEGSNDALEAGAGGSTEAA